MRIETDNTFQDVNGFGSPDGLGFGSFGADAPQAVEIVQNPAVRALKIAYAVASLAGTGIGAYHGYKRNDSVGWAIGWALLGGLFPVIVIPVAYAQGIGKHKHR